MVLVAFKTTSAPDHAHFVATIDQYNYDRQAPRFIIGLQKKSPFEVWQFKVTPAPGLIEHGRRKYQWLMKASVQQQVQSSLPTTPAHRARQI